MLLSEEKSFKEKVKWNIKIMKCDRMNRRKKKKEKKEMHFVFLFRG